MRKIFEKYWEVISYCIFGVGTTIVNIVTYYLGVYLFNMATVIGTCMSWILSVLFAYITNKIWVFQSNTTGVKEILKEIFFFFTSRFLSGLLDIGIMYIFVEKYHFNDMYMKIISNIVVIIVNYLASKTLIFRT